jgi:outer membrane lipoprotein-sorting protein
MKKILLLSCFLIPSILFAQDKSVDALTVWNNYLEAIGGEDLKQIKTFESINNFGVNTKATMEVKIIYPNKHYMKISDPEGEFISIYNDGQGINIIDGKATKMSESELHSSRMSSLIFPEYYAEEQGNKIILEETIEGESETTYVISVSDEYRSMKYHISGKTWLPIKSEDMGKELILNTFITEQNITMPSKSTFIADGYEFSVELVSFKLNGKIKKSYFDISKYTK